MTSLIKETCLGCIPGQRCSNHRWPTVRLSLLILLADQLKNNLRPCMRFDVVTDFSKVISLACSLLMGKTLHVAVPGSRTRRLSLPDSHQSHRFCKPHKSIHWEHYMLALPSSCKFIRHSVYLLIRREDPAYASATATSSRLVGENFPFSWPSIITISPRR